MSVKKSGLNLVSRTALAPDGTNDLLVSDVIRTNEQQVWFLAEHPVDAPLVRDQV